MKQDFLKKIENQVVEYNQLQQHWGLPKFLARPAYSFGLNFLKTGLLVAFSISLLLSLFLWPKIINLAKWLLLLS